MTNLGIIIIGYNSQKYLNDCLGSIEKSTYKSYKIIFVDNNSTDNSIEFIKNKYPKVTIIVNDRNFGFASANNIGIKKAFELKCDHLLLLNPDTLIDKNCLSLLIQRADSKTILQPLVLLNIGSINTDLVNTTGGDLNFLGFSHCSDYKKNKTVVMEKDIAIASGVAVFIPTIILKKIGLFDESFFMYHEDVDLFWRARLSGYNIKLLPKCLVWHKYSFSRNKNKVFYVERNRLIFLYKNFTFKYLILILPAFLLNEIFIIFYSLFGGWFLIKINAYFSATSQIKSQRRHGNKSLKSNISTNRLKKFIKPEIVFSEVNIPFIKLYNVFLDLYWMIVKKMI